MKGALAADRADESVTEAAADEVSEEGADTFAELFDEDTEGNIAEVRFIRSGAWRFTAASAVQLYTPQSNSPCNVPAVVSMSVAQLPKAAIA